MTFQKVAVPVRADFNTDGKVTPRCFIWNEERFLIDEAEEIPCFQKQMGGSTLPAMVFKCLVRNQIMHLYLLHGIWQVCVFDREGGIAND